MKESHEYYVGQEVFIYSTSLDEIIQGIIEGFDDEENHRVKVIQETIEGKLRHIVSWVFIATSLEEAVKIKQESNNYSSQPEFKSGQVVHLRTPTGLAEYNGTLLEFQITTVYREKRKVALINHEQEYIGVHPMENLCYVRDEPLFSKEKYRVLDKVIWIEGEDVYEGKITYTHETTAEVSDIKKLYPIDYKKRIPYYKLSKVSDAEETSSVIATVIGDSII